MSVAESWLMAIYANRDTGEPYTGPGRIGHVVRVGPNPDMPIVQEFSDGGVFEHEDCAPASMYSRCLEGGVKATVRELEQLAGTNLNGTGFPGCVVALEHFGIAAALSNVARAGYVMNPMIPSIVPASDFARYLAAAQEGNCFVSMAASDPAPTPPTPVPEEDEVPFLATAGVRPKGETADPNGQGAIYLCFGAFKRHIVGAVAGAIPELEAEYGILQDWSQKPFDLDHAFVELAPLDGSYPVLGWSRPASWQPPGPVA